MNTAIKTTKSATKFTGSRMIAAGGLIYAFVGALGLTVAQLSNAYMVLDPAVTMNRTVLGLGFQAFILLQGLTAPLVGLLIAKKGARFSYILGSTITAIMGALLAIFLGGNAVFYVLGFGVIMSYGCMSAGAIPTFTTLNNWYKLNRGRAISIALIIGATIAVFYPLITNWVIKLFSWHSGYWLVAGFAVIGLLLSIFVIKDKPADVGQEMDGGATAFKKGASKKSYISRVYQTMENKSALEAVKTPAFWFIGLTAFTCFAALNLNVSQAGLYFVSQGLTLDDVSVALSLKAIGGIAALLFCSFLIDRVEPIRVHGLAALLMGLGALVTVLVGGSMIIMIAYYVIVGLGFATHNACLPAELANIFGNVHYSKIHGWLLPIIAVLASFVPTIAGTVFDVTGSYVPAFIGLAIIGLAGFISSCLVRVPKTKVAANANADSEPKPK
ncbi:MAG: MFS transporter [Peptococcaceae bacterium]|jgi:MFS family permease|nr:MFS transporter [Peptococcaceae bacterium]